MDKDDIFTGIGCGTVIIGFIFLMVFSPVLTFGFAYLGGMILDWIV